MKRTTKKQLQDDLKALRLELTLANEALAKADKAKFDLEQCHGWLSSARYQVGFARAEFERARRSRRKR